MSNMGHKSRKKRMRQAGLVLMIERKPVEGSRYKRTKLTKRWVTLASLVTQKASTVAARKTQPDRRSSFGKVSGKVPSYPMSRSPRQ